MPEKAKKIYYIYVIRNETNGKRYVGQTNDPKYRWWKHKNHARINDRDQPIYSAIRKYGADNFTFTVIEEYDTLDEVNKAEEFWIRFLLTRMKKFGYNISYGGDNHTLSDEVRKKISATLMGRSCSPATTFKPGHKMKIGSESTSSVLNDDKVREIRKLLETDMMQKDIAKLFGISKSLMSNVATGKKWTHVK